MPSVQSMAFVPIAQAEKLIVQKQAQDTLATRKEGAVRIVEDLRSKGFNMSVERVLERDLVYLNSWGIYPKSVEEQIMNTQDENLLVELKRKIAYCALRQLGAVYCVTRKGGWGEYKSFEYDSPTLGKREIQLVGDFGFFNNHEFDPDVAFKDIPLLIERSRVLAKELKEKGLVIN